MPAEVIPGILRSPEVARLIEHHRSHHGLATLVAPDQEGMAVSRGKTRVASLQATGPRDAVEALALALGALLDLEESARRRHADLGRRLGHLSQRLERLKGEYDEDLKQRTADLLKVNRRLVTAATTDPLTGLLNRRAIEARMRELETLSQDEPLSLAVIMVDVDHFKQVNDSFGHLVGDAVLAQVAELIRCRCRQSDAVGRWGGEEFLVLLAGCTLSSAGRIAEDLRAQVGEYPFHVAGGSFAVTASFGVAAGQIGAGRPPPIELVATADQCLYTAKASGRNRVATAEPPSVSQAS